MEFATTIEVWLEAESLASAKKIALELTSSLLENEAVVATTTLEPEECDD